MKTKKIIAAVAAFVMVCGAVPSQPFANIVKNSAVTANAETSDYEVIKEGYFTYNVYSDHAEVATYKNYTQEAVELKSEVNGVPLTNIANYAFSSTSLTSIVIPNSVKSIGMDAFDACNRLETVIIADSIEIIGAGAFSRCRALKNINIPNSVTSIGNGAFSGCESLETIEIPDSVITFGNGLFEFCSNLKYIEIPSSMTRIGKNSFYDNYSLKEITIPDTVKSIGEYAFRGCKVLESITILNPDCHIEDNSKSTISNGTNNLIDYFDGTIYGYENSTAQAFAEKCHYNFVSLGGPPIETKLGDVDGDGTISAMDASAALTYYVTQPENIEDLGFPFNEKAADWDENGIIDARDASAILTYYVNNN